MRDIEERLRRIEERLEFLERRQARPEPVAAPAVQVADDLEAADFDLGLLGRTLIVLGGAYLLRAITEGGFLPQTAGIIVGLAYALTWSLLALRPSVTRTSAAYHGAATAFIALPLIFEAVRKFHRFDATSSAIALTVVTIAIVVLVWRRELQGLAWLFVLMVLVVVPVMMGLTEELIPCTLYLGALGIATLWLGYVLDWHLLRWPVAAELNVVLLVLSYFAVSGRVSSGAAIAVDCLVFAAYLGSFALRTLVRRREVVAFEIAQMLAVLVVGLGGAMWIAASSATLEIPITMAMFTLALASYAVSFAFMLTPRNFVFYSSLALMLIVAGGAFVSRGGLMWSALALASAYAAVRFRKSSLALHAAVYLVAGFAGAGILQFGLQALVFTIRAPLAIPADALLLLAACVIAAAMKPIERQGTFALWTTAKAVILAEIGWVGASLLVAALAANRVPDPAYAAVARTAVIAALTIATAWVSRFPRLSPARLLCNPLMVALALKLMWEDFRAGRPATLFASLAIVGVALIVTPRLRRREGDLRPGVAGDVVYR